MFHSLPFCKEVRIKIRGVERKQDDQGKTELQGLGLLAQMREAFAVFAGWLGVAWWGSRKPSEVGFLGCRGGAFSASAASGQLSGVVSRTRKATRPYLS